MTPALFLPDLLATPVLAAILALITRYDLRSHRIPDALSLPLLAAGLLLAWLRAGGLPWPELAGAAAGYGVFAAIGAVFYRLRGVDGLGLGDAKLLGAAGAWLGWEALPALVLIASLGALLAAKIAARDRDHRLAFGPWLSAAFLLLWLLRLSGPLSGGAL